MTKAVSFETRNVSVVTSTFVCLVGAGYCATLAAADCAFRSAFMPL